MVDTQMSVKKKTCYVAMPFGEREGRDFDTLYSFVIKPVIEDCGLECIRSDEFPQRGASEKAIIQAAIKSDVMIADVSVKNPNVMYQLGARHAASYGKTILISDEPHLPFNISVGGILRYTHSVSGYEVLRKKLVAVFEDTAGHTGSHSPIHDLFPGLQLNVAKDPCVFIGHGRNPLWARVQIFLEQDLNLATVGYESESRVGSSIIKVLEGMLERATFAVLVLTAEDETTSGSVRARQNVVHEAGLFQGRLGFERVTVLKQDGTEEFSNIAGLQYISFPENRIDQSFYELQKALRREGLIP